MSHDHKYPAPIAFRDRVKAEMEKQNVSVRGLAKEAGISPGFLSYILNGKRKPLEENIVSIAKALNIDAEDLLLDAGYATPKNDDVKLLFRTANKMTPEQIEEIKTFMLNMIEEEE